MTTNKKARVEALRQRLTKVQAKIDKEEAKERAAALATIHALMDEHSLTIADVRQPARKRIAANPKVAAKRKVEAKYRDPATGKTWSGRGLAPLWIRDKKRERFLIAE
ncbi:H-NS family nucleoid-associated regulatory protein [Paraburkholderia panacisoli]|nr:H-NS histone family protein [Paraburkholderia panacisoli]